VVDLTRYSPRICFTSSSESGGKTAALLLPSLSRFRDWNEMDSAMHWGQARVRPRYAEAVTARLAHAVPASSVAFSRD